jgi:hypothetical protein
MGALQSALSSQPRYSDLLKGEELAKVLQHGLPVLDDEALVRLALNPIALWQVHDRLLCSESESAGDRWAYLMCDAELEARGLHSWPEWVKESEAAARRTATVSPSVEPRHGSEARSFAAAVSSRHWRATTQHDLPLAAADADSDLELRPVIFATVAIDGVEYSLSEGEHGIFMEGAIPNEVGHVRFGDQVCELRCTDPQQERRELAGIRIAELQTFLNKRAQQPENYPVRFLR